MFKICLGQLLLNILKMIFAAGLTNLLFPYKTCIIVKHKCFRYEMTFGV